MKIHFTVVTRYEVDVDYPLGEDRDDGFVAACKEIREQTDTVIARSRKIGSAIDQISEER